MARTRTTPAAALVEQARSIHAWAAALDAEDLRRETALPGWDVAALLVHLDVVLDDLVVVVGRPSGQPPVSNAAFVTGYAPAAEQMRDRARAEAAATDAATLVGRLAGSVERAAEALDPGTPLPAVVEGARGPITPADFVASRVLELVVHADDLSRALPAREPVPLVRAAVGVACRTLTGILADRYPGRSVEVRVPPYAAVQCSVVRDGAVDPGPTHTRGTPPNVVETDAATFLRLCTGRESWATALASGRVAASGLRADLAEMLPLLT